MSRLNIIADAAIATPPDCAPESTTHHVSEGVTICRFPRGISNGESSVAIVAKLPNGDTVAIETSLAEFVVAASALFAAEVADERAKN